MDRVLDFVECNHQLLKLTHHLLGASGLEGTSLGSKPLPYPPIWRAELCMLKVLL